MNMLHNRQLQNGWAVIKSSSRRLAPLAIMAVFGIAGSYMLTMSHAATPTAAIETETGTRSGGTSVISDSNASGDSAIKFSGTVAQPATCDFNATTSTFAAQVSTATGGQTICLASGSYGNWAGTNKAITIMAATGATPTMTFNFGSGSSSFTLDGISGLSGTIQGLAHDITIRNSTFAGETDVLMDQMQNANILFDHDHFPAFVGTARLWTYNYNASGATGATPSGVVVQNSTFDNPSNLSGVADGVRCDGASIQILNNDFSGIRDAADGTGNHGDPIQIYGGTHCIMRGNYFHDMVESATCSLGEWDGGDHNVFENNVVHTGSCYEAVALLADQSSLVDHNTFIAPSSGCFANPQAECAAVSTGAKSGQSGSGTVYRDNVMAYFGNSGGATYSEHHNLCTSSCGGGSGDIIGMPILSGGASPTTWSGYKLASNSPGYGAASDGLSMGIN